MTTPLSITAAKVQALLPAGWKAEDYGGCVVASNGRGGVTIDIDRREFRLGWVTHGRARNTAIYAGRGWLERLVSDAVACLEDAQRGRP